MIPTGAAPLDAPCPRHPEAPAVFACARCGSFGCVACAVPTQRGPICTACAAFVAAAVGGGVFLWERRAEVGLFTGFVRSAWSLSIRPKATWPLVAADGGAAAPTLFALVANLLDFLLVPPLAALAVAIAAADAANGWPVEPIWVEAGAALGAILSILLLTPLFGLLAAGTELLSLRAAGAGATFASTYRIWCYSQAPGLLGPATSLTWISCLPGVSAVWQRFCRARAYEQRHALGFGSALAAAFVPLAAVVALAAVVLVGVSAYYGSRY